MKTFLISLLLVVVCGCSSAQTKPKSFAKPIQACKEGEQRGGGGWGQIGGPWHLDPLEICRSEKWVSDEEQIKKNEIRRKENEAYDARVRKHKADLWNGLLTRVVTNAELMEVLETGYSLVPEKDGGVVYLSCPDGCSYSESAEQEKKVAAEKIFQNALLVQFKIRLAAKQ